MTKYMNRVKNVLQVMPEFGLAGAETMCEALCYELQKTEKYKVFVASLFDFRSPITERLEANGVKIFYVGKMKGTDLSVIGKLKNIMIDEQVDIVHTHRYVMQYAIPAAVMAKVPCRIHTVHNIATEEVDKLRRIFASIFYRFCKVQPISISPKVRDSVQQEYRIGIENLPVVYNGSDLSRCIIKNNYTVSETFNFVHIGRFTPVKNQSLIVDAISQLKTEGYNVHVDLLGGAGNEKEIEKKVIKLNLENEITLCGLQSNVYPFISKGDVFLLPSRYEGMPITLIEAMGSGMPIIASNVGGIPDMIEHGKEGLLIDPNLDELVEAMKLLINNQDLREKIGVAARIKAQQFSSKNMCQGYIEQYEKGG